MSEAVIGLIGVGVGALVTGGVQGVLAWHERRLASVTSARMLWSYLSDVVTSLDIAAEDQTFAGMRDFERALAGWNDERRAIARFTGAREFQQIAGAFDLVRGITTLRDAAQEAGIPDEGWASFTRSNPGTPELIERVRAMVLTLGTTRADTWWRNRRSMRRTEYYEELARSIRRDTEAVERARGAPG